MLAVISNKNFRNLWLAQITSQIAINMMAFILAIRVYQETFSNTYVSLTVLSIGLPALIFGLPAGVVADYFDKKRILFLTNLLRALLVLGFFFSTKSLAWIYLLAFFASFLTQFFVPCEAPLIAKLVKPPKLLLTANSLFSLSFYSSMALGFLLSGPALSLFGTRDVFLFVSFLLFLASIFVFKLPSEHKKAVIPWINFGGKIKKLLGSIFTAFKFILNKKAVSGALFLLLLVQATVALFSSLLPGFADEVLKIKLENASLFLLGPAILGIILGSFSLSVLGKRLKRERLVSLALIFSGGFLLFLSSASLYLAMILLFFLGIAQAQVIIPANTTLQEKSRAELRGRVYGVLTSLVGGLSILPAVLGGIIADTFGVGRTIFALGALILLYGVYRMKKR